MLNLAHIKFSDSLPHTLLTCCGVSPPTMLPTTTRPSTRPVPTPVCRSMRAGKASATYTVTVGAAVTGHALVGNETVIGDIVGSDGKAYHAADKDKLPAGVNAEIPKS